MPQVVVVKELNGNDDRDTDDDVPHINADPDELLLSSEVDTNESSMFKVHG